MDKNSCKWPACPCRATGIFCANKPSKKVKVALKRTPIKKISEKGKQRKNLKKELVKQDIDFYEQIWLKRPHTCFESGLPVLIASLLNFHHVLEKDLFPQYRYCEWNIVILLWEEHDKVHRLIDLTPKVKALRAELLQKHENGEFQPCKYIKS